MSRPQDLIPVRTALQRAAEIIGRMDCDAHAKYCRCVQQMLLVRVWVNLDRAVREHSSDLPFWTAVFWTKAAQESLARRRSTLSES